MKWCKNLHSKCDLGFCLHGAVISFMKIKSNCDVPLYILVFKKDFPNCYIFQLLQEIFESI